MKKTGMMVLILALTATGLMAQPNSNFAFDIVVNDTYTITPTYSTGSGTSNPHGQLPDCEVGLSYANARVFLKRPANFGTYVFQGMVVNNTNPWPSGIVLASPKYDKYFTGIPSGSGTYFMWMATVWLDTATNTTKQGVLQGYEIEMRPYGYGVTYPPPNGGSSSGSGDDDEGCVANNTNSTLGLVCFMAVVLLLVRARKPELEA